MSKKIAHNGVAKSIISYTLKTAYFVAILSLVIFFFWKSPVALAVFALSFFFALVIEGMLFAFGFGLFTETKSVLIAAIVTFVFVGILSIFLPNHSNLYFISSCSMLPSYSQGDAVLVLQEGQLAAPIVKIDVPYFEGKTEVYGGNETLFIDGSLYGYCNGNANALCNQFRKNPLHFSEKKGSIVFQYDACMRSNGVSSPCVVSATIGNSLIPVSHSGDAVLFSGDFTGADAGLPIAHRLMFGINDSNGNVYYFTKGDNNPIYDVQFYNNERGTGGRALSSDSVLGKVMLKLPLLGLFSKNYNASIVYSSCWNYYVQ